MQALNALRPPTPTTKQQKQKTNKYLENVLKRFVWKRKVLKSVEADKSHGNERAIYI